MTTRKATATAMCSGNSKGNRDGNSNGNGNSNRKGNGRSFDWVAHKIREQLRSG
jgi:hypothetical protein